MLYFPLIVVEVHQHSRSIRGQRTKFVYTKKLDYTGAKIDYYIELIVMSHGELR